MCNRLHTIPACDGPTNGQTDRQTDGQTSCHGIVRAMYTRRAVKTGKYFDFINENRTSSDALRPIFPKLLLKA